jgi:hypothetical protein
MATTYRRAHTYTRNGKTFQRRGTKVNYEAAKRAGMLGGGLVGTGLLYSTGLALGPAVVAVTGVFFAVKYRRQVAFLSRSMWRSTKKAARGIRRTHRTAKAIQHGPTSTPMLAASVFGPVAKKAPAEQPSSQVPKVAAVKPPETLGHTDTAQRAAAPKALVEQPHTQSEPKNLREHTYVSQTGRNAAYCGACGHSRNISAHVATPSLITLTAADAQSMGGGWRAGDKQCSRDGSGYNPACATCRSIFQ